MVDNVTAEKVLNPLGPTFATADIDGVQYPKSILAGGNGVNVGVNDTGALRVQFPEGNRTAFDEIAVAEPSLACEMHFAYGALAWQVVQQNNQSGSFSVVNHQAELSSGAAANSSSTIQSRLPVRYIPGKGVAARFTAVFDTPAAGNIQTIGIGTAQEGFFFGYNGTSFGVLHRLGGEPEVRALTVTTASSDAESITITLDGETASVPVTASGVITTTANEIAAFDYSDVGPGWDAIARGEKVIFIAWDSSSRTGTYSLSGATSAVGTFAQSLAGIAPTETWVAQSSWNGQDTFDGTGPTGVTLNPQAGNVFQIKFQWLGYGLISFYAEDPDDGELHLVHAIEYANANTNPSLQVPSLKLFAQTKNVANTTDIVLKTPCMAAYIEGKIPQFGRRAGLTVESKTGLNTSYVPVMSFKMANVFNGTQNRQLLKVNLISVANDHNKAMLFRFAGNMTLTGASFSEIASGQSSVLLDTSATAATGGQEFFTLPLGAGDSAIIDLSSDYFAGLFTAGDVVTCSARTASGTGGEASVSFNVIELV